MLRFVLTASIIPVTSYAAATTTAHTLALDPGLIAGMIVLIAAQLTVAQLRSNWEQQQVTTQG